MPKPEPGRKPPPPRDPRPPGPRPAPPREPAPKPAPAAHGIAGETGWLPDCVYTGDTFESGVAFFADALGRITRFSREPADLAAARRLAGQAALPGLVNTHSHAFHRTLRGRTELRGRGDPVALWAEAHDRVLGRLTDEDVFDTARMAFLEMLLSGITCVGEFHYVHHQPDGTAWPDANHLAREVLRAARDVGIRIALLKVAWLQGDLRGQPGSAPARVRAAGIDAFLRELDALRAAVAAEHPADEAWVGVAPHSVLAVPLDAFKAIGAHAHAQRLRLHTHLPVHAAENASCLAGYGRTPVTLLAENGLVDKRFTAVHAAHVSDEEAKLLGAARAAVCVCPQAEHLAGAAGGPLEALVAAGAALALGTDGHGQIDLLKEARLLALRQRGALAARPGEPAAALLHAATFTGARSLGATGGALEVGRPADFFTVNLYEPSIAGADADSLLPNILFALERRAIREVWVGARQRIAAGRHVNQGTIVVRFVEAQKRLWA